MPDSRFTLANGIKLHYLDWRGSGPAVICIHGVTGNARAWDAVAEQLSPQYRVLALDLRGHGDSDKPQKGYATADFAADVEAFALALGLQRFILMGHSLGTRIASLYASQHPSRVSHLVLEDPYYPLGSGPSAGSVAVQERVNTRPTTFANLEEAADWMGGETDLLAPALRRDRVSRESLRAQASNALRQRADGAWEWKYSHAAVLEILRLIQENGDDDIMAALSKITAPALLIRGGDSNVCPPGAAERIRKGIPNCKVVSIPDVAHSVHGEKPGDFMAAVRAFLE